MPAKIYFKGAGLITALGDNVDDVLNATGKEVQPSSVNIHQSQGEVKVPYFTITKPGVDAGVGRIYTIIDAVVGDAIKESGLTGDQLLQAGLFIGSTSFDMFRCENAIKNSPRDDVHISQSVPPFSELANYVQSAFSIMGPVFSFNTACTSSANALMYAAESIRRGDITHAVVLGLEFFNEVTALGFSSLSLISKKGMQPFDTGRDGLYLGEGCGALVISAEPSEDDRFAYLSGANIGDNFSITASNPKGLVVQKVIENALSNAGLSILDINVVKTHGTASLSNDEAESAGLERVFGNSVPPIVALKPLIGHTLGACGIIELILFYKALSQNRLLTFNCQISEEFPLRLASNEDVSNSGYYLLNYFGFGGNSTALVICNA